MIEFISALAATPLASLTVGQLLGGIAWALGGIAAVIALVMLVIFLGYLV